MGPKQFLRSIRDLDNETKAKFEQLEELRSLAAKTTYALSNAGGPQTRGKNDTLAEIVAKIIDLSNGFDASIKRLLEKKTSALLIIEQMSDSRYRTVLYQYYFNRKTWEQIAVEMHYTYKWVHVLHGRALLAFEERFLEMKKST